MRPIGVKRQIHNVFGGKALNRGMKFGAKALGYIGDMAPAAMIIAPEAAPVLEAAKAASIGLDSLRKTRQAIKYR